jgi:hypothetical protein
MEQININGSNRVIASIPAGVAFVTLAGTAAAFTLDNGQASADVLEFSNASGAAQTITVPQPSIPMQDSTAYPLVPPAAFNPPRTVSSWVKVIKNASGGALTFKGIVTATGLPTAAGLLVANGDTKLVIFDGTNTPFTLT